MASMWSFIVHLSYNHNGREIRGQEVVTTSTPLSDTPVMLMSTLNACRNNFGNHMSVNPRFVMVTWFGAVVADERLDGA